MIFSKDGGSWLVLMLQKELLGQQQNPRRLSGPCIFCGQRMVSCLVGATVGRGLPSWVPHMLLTSVKEAGMGILCQLCACRTNLKEPGVRINEWHPLPYSKNPAHFTWDKFQHLVTLAPRGGHFYDWSLLAPGSSRCGRGDLSGWWMTCGPSADLAARLLLLKEQGRGEMKPPPKGRVGTCHTVERILTTTAGLKPATLVNSLVNRT